jgi:hypothetical protein
LSLFPTVLLFFSSCTGQHHPTPFPVNTRYAGERFPLERAVLQAPDQTGFAKKRLQAHYDLFTLARRGV